MHEVGCLFGAKEDVVGRRAAREGESYIAECRCQSRLLSVRRHQRDNAAMRCRQSCDSINEVHVSAAHVVRVNWERGDVRFGRSRSWLDVDKDLQRRVEPVEEATKCADPTDTIGLSGTCKADGAGLDHSRFGGAIPQDCWSPGGQTQRAEFDIWNHADAAMPSASARNARLAGASGNATTVAWLRAAASRTCSSSGMRPATYGPNPRSR